MFNKISGMLIPEILSKHFLQILGVTKAVDFLSVDTNCQYKHNFLRHHKQQHPIPCILVNYCFNRTL